MSSKRRRGAAANNKFLLSVTPIYESHPNANSEPLILSKLPTVLSRHQLCGLWWMNCPYHCRRTPSNSASEKNVCGRYCHNIRKVAIHQEPAVAHRRQRPKRNYELLSRQSIYVNDLGQCEIIAKHPEYYQLQRSKKTTNGTRLRISNSEELWMLFHIELIMEETDQYSDDSSEAIETQQKNDTYYDTQHLLRNARDMVRKPFVESRSSQSSDDLSFMQLYTGKRKRLAQDSLKEETISCNQAQDENGWMLVHNSNKKRRNTMKRAYEWMLASSSESNVKRTLGWSESEESKADSPTENHVSPAQSSKPHAHAHASSTRRSLLFRPDSAKSQITGTMNRDQQPESQANESVQIRTIQKTDCSPQHNDVAIERVHSQPVPEPEPKQSDPRCTTATVIRRDLLGSQPVKVVTPDTTLTAKTKLTAATTRLEEGTEEGKGMDEIQTTNTAIAPLPVSTRQLMRKRISIRPTASSLPTESQTKNHQSHPSTNTTGSTTCHTSDIPVDSVLDMKLEPSVSPTQNDHNNIYEASQQVLAASTFTTIRQCSLTDIHAQQLLAQPGSFRRAILDCILALNRDNVDGTLPLQLPALLAPDTIWQLDKDDSNW
jgi:hypothetical protein